MGSSAITLSLQLNLYGKMIVSQTVFSEGK